MLWFFFNAFIIIFSGIFSSFHLLISFLLFSCVFSSGFKMKFRLLYSPIPRLLYLRLNALHFTRIVLRWGNGFNVRKAKKSITNPRISLWISNKLMAGEFIYLLLILVLSLALAFRINIMKYSPLTLTLNHNKRYRMLYIYNIHTVCHKKSLHRRKNVKCDLHSNSNNKIFSYFFIFLHTFYN